MSKSIQLLIVALLVFGCNKKEGSLFKSLSSEKTKIDFQNTVTASNQLNILDYLYFYNGGGVAVGDINNDGLPDIYLSANQGSNKLYLNKGDFTFEDITETAKVGGKSDWNTGTVMADVNNDGYLDIYLCAVVGINGFDGHNELYINNGDNTFTEKSAFYGLDFDTYSSSAAFLDYDLDGDLDLYILNHAVHTPESFGKSDIRTKRNYETGDRLLRNDGGKFTDVSEEAGIYGGINGYGLGITVSDFNKDGYPDLYVGNDFHEDDYYYINQGNGTFKESLKNYFGHITRFSMGNDVADINHDGWPDLMSLDMLPEDEKTIKSSEGDDNYQTLQLRTKNYGYHYQFTRNMLHINQQEAAFAETGLLSGVAATDWSWSVLMEDFNLDAHTDMYIANGIPKRPNDLDFIKFVSNEKIQKKITSTKLVDNEAFTLMPSGKLPNYIFEGTGSLKFNNQTGNWISKDSTVSTSLAFGDFDNDGDIDVVVNNINEPVTLLQNKTDGKSNFLKIKFNYSKANPFGIGTKVYSYHKGLTQYKELYTSRGFQSSSEPTLFFGYGKSTIVDSLKVVWPNQTTQILKDINSNQTLVLTPKNTKPHKFNRQKNNRVFKKIENSFGVNFTHKEDRFVDFHRQILIPYQVSTLGPATAVGDLNKDGLQDIYLGGSKYTPSSTYLQTKDGTFEKADFSTIKNDSLIENTSAVIIDIDKDGNNDILTTTGGADFGETQPHLKNKLYLNKQNNFTEAILNDAKDNASIVLYKDIDKDGDIDLFIGNHVVSNKFGQTNKSYILRNKNGTFEKEEIELKSQGMVTHATWSDFDKDGVDDLIIVGEWMSPSFLKNSNGNFKEVNVLTSSLNGLWQQVIEFDIDNDGDKDYLLGNWGNNTKFKASAEHPLKLYFEDFDKNGVKEPIVAKYKESNYYPIATFDELSFQIPSLRKKFNTYKEFAGTPINQIFDQKQLDSASKLEVTELASGYLENNHGKFNFIPFDFTLQTAPIKSFLKHDFNEDQKEEVLVGGNFFGVAPYHGRFDSFSGAVIYSNNNIKLSHSLGIDFSQKSVRHLKIINIKNRPYLLVTYNNEKAEIYEF